MNDTQRIQVSVPPGLLPAKRLHVLGNGDPRMPLGDGPRGACQVVMAAPAMACSSPAENRSDRRRVARASRKLGEAAST